MRKGTILGSYVDSKTKVIKRRTLDIKNVTEIAIDKIYANPFSLIQLSYRLIQHELPREIKQFISIQKLDF